MVFSGSSALNQNVPRAALGPHCRLKASPTVLFAYYALTWRLCAAATLQRLTPWSPPQDKRNVSQHRLQRTSEKASNELQRAVESGYKPALGVSPAGESPWPCSKSVAHKDFAKCPNATVDSYRQLSHILRHDESLQGLTDSLFLVAESNKKSLSPCRVDMSPDPVAALFEVSVDLQYSNSPRCCVPHEISTEKLEDSELASQGQWQGVNYTLLSPKPSKCTWRLKCPLVVEVPGAAGIPWLIHQQSCNLCARTLGAFLMYLDDHAVSSHYVTEIFIPAVEDIRRNQLIDRSRIYLVSASRGNEVALNAAFARPDLFSFVLMAGKFAFNADLKSIIHSAGAPSNARLKSVVLFVGESDGVHDENAKFFSRLQEYVGSSKLNPKVKLRIMPGSQHAVWYAAWNAFHDLIWKGLGKPTEYNGLVPLTCVST